MEITMDEVYDFFDSLMYGVHKNSIITEEKKDKYISYLERLRDTCLRDGVQGVKIKVVK